jgi:hypothetical protein
MPASTAFLDKTPQSIGRGQRRLTGNGVSDATGDHAVRQDEARRSV